MGMRLLPKSELTKAIASEQKMTVDEGAKLARRIDSLREIAAQEEVSLEKFRRETVAKIHEQITKLAAERDEIEADVALAALDLKEKRKPLDKEWEKVVEERKELESRGEKATLRENFLRDEEEAVRRDCKEVEIELTKANQYRLLGESRLRDAEQAAEKAELAQKAADVAEKEAKELKESTEREVTHRISVVESLEKNATVRETELAAREKELVDGLRLLKDREAMLERNLKRNK